MGNSDVSSLIKEQGAEWRKWKESRGVNGGPVPKILVGSPDYPKGGGAQVYVAR